MAQGQIWGQSSGGLSIQGMIEEYKVAAEGNISAGDFVEYIESLQYGNNTELNSNQYSGSVISAVALSENKVFIVHSGGSNYYLYRNDSNNNWNNSYNSNYY